MCDLTGDDVVMMYFGYFATPVHYLWSHLNVVGMMVVVEAVSVGFLALALLFGHLLHCSCCSWPSWLLVGWL